MEATAIVYVSNTGYTAAYAGLLGKQTGLPVYPLAEAEKALPKGERILFLGWLMAGFLRGYRKAARRFRIQAAYGVGLGDTGSQVETVRRTNRIPAGTALYTLQGGMDHARLTGVYKSMINTLIRTMSAKKNRTPDEDRMLELLIQGGCYVSEENLKKCR